jgi:uncharacterized protein YbbK (DUF523 family)
MWEAAIELSKELLSILMSVCIHTKDMRYKGKIKELEFCTLSNKQPRELCMYLAE